MSRLALALTLALVASACAHVAARGQVGSSRRAKRSTTSVWVDGKQKGHVEQSSREESSSGAFGIDAR